MESLLDATTLNKETFETAIAVGMKMKDMLTMFRVTGMEMDAWCEKEYGLKQFAMVYQICKQRVICDYLDCVKKLGLRGNVSALNIIDSVLRGTKEEQTVQIVFSGNMEKETEDDKRND